MAAGIDASPRTPSLDPPARLAAQARVAVYTDITDAELESFLAEFDLGRLVSLKGIAEGVSNSNFLLETDRDRFILTLYEKRTPEAELPYFIELMQWLSRQGYPAPMPQTDRQGRTLKRLAGKPAALVSFLSGYSVKRPTAQHCREAGVACHVVPGVTAALAAGAGAGAPLTHRGAAQAVTFVTGHAAKGHAPNLDWAALARPNHTVVVYMGVSMAGPIADHLLAAGRDGATPALIVENASRADERRIVTILAQLADAARSVTGPALLVVGEAMALVETGGASKAQFLDFLTSTLFNAPIYRNYGAMIVKETFAPAGFGAELAAKDMRLADEAAQTLGVAMPLNDLLRARLKRLIEGGEGHLDLTALSLLARRDVR